MNTMICTYATVHWIRFTKDQRAEALDLSKAPMGAASWKIGPDSPLGVDGRRLPASHEWCGVALYSDRVCAENAFDDVGAFLPFLSQAAESWHALLLPVTHRGDCNHLNKSTAGQVLAPAHSDPGGPLFVLTTAGFNVAPNMNMERVKDFRRQAARVVEWMRALDGLIAAHTFEPQTRGDDGVTMSLWKDDVSMTNFAYHPGMHRTQLDRYKAEHTADRTSFTRCRVLRSMGEWNGEDPLSLCEPSSQELR